MKRAVMASAAAGGGGTGTCSETLTSKKPKLAKGTGHWSMKLLEAMEDPEKIVQSDELTVTIKDAYPKARHHYLVLCKANLPHLRSLNGSHLSLLTKMLENGKAVAEKTRRNYDSEDKKPAFRYGYHASPSMSRLHMHVISQDLDSPCLKHKKHWNSFTTDFFVDAEKVIEILKDKGKVELDVKGVYEPLLKLQLKCHVCHSLFPNLPRLKDHIKSHFP